MKKTFVLLLMPLLLGCASFTQVHAEEEKDFIATELNITDFNYKALQYSRSTRGIKIQKADDMSSTDAYLRFDGINEIHEVGVSANKYLAIRYRSNYDPQFALRIKSTTGNKNWSDFHFSSSRAGHIDNIVGTWNTYVYYLDFSNASSVSGDEYQSWTMGDYIGVSFNITNSDSFTLSESYLYISSFAFFASEEEANNYSGLEYARNVDSEGPAITIPYGNGETFKTTAGKSYEFYAEAYDEYDDISSIVEGELSDGALDENNKLVQGNNTVTFKAYDYSNNESIKVLNLIVDEKDTVPPVINCDMDTIYVQTGTYNRLVFTAYDEIDGEIICEYSYSENAVDESGRFLAGNHTLTVTATDLTGNTATKNISLIVGDDFNPDNLEVIEEEK